MTDLVKQVSRRTREGFRSSRGRRIIVSIIPGDVIGFREERTRTTFTLPIEDVYRFACRKHAEAKRAEHKAKKKQHSN